MSGLVPRRFDVLAHRGGEQAPVVLRWEGGEYDYTVIADGPWGQVTGRGTDSFEALLRVREQIEPAGWLLGVNGARRDTWPSGMCRGMGGFLVYRLTLNQRLSGADRVQTFHEAPREALATIDEQIRFEQQWSATP